MNFIKLDDHIVNLQRVICIYANSSDIVVKFDDNISYLSIDLNKENIQTILDAIGIDLSKKEE